MQSSTKVANKTKKRLALAGLAIILAAGVWYVSAPLLLGAGCVTEELQREDSPDGSFRAVLSYRECMLADGAHELNLGTGWSNSAIFSHIDRFDFCWKSPRELVVQSLPAPYLMETASKGVQIIYGDMHECPSKTPAN
jgi:hypothetical protein